MAKKDNYYDIISRLDSLKESILDPDNINIKKAYYELNTIIFDYDCLRDNYISKVKNVHNNYNSEKYLKESVRTYIRIKDIVCKECKKNEIEMKYMDTDKEILSTFIKSSNNLNYKPFRSYFKMPNETYIKSLHKEMFSLSLSFVSNSEQYRHLSDYPFLSIYESLIAKESKGRKHHPLTFKLNVRSGLYNFYVANFGAMLLRDIIKRNTNIEYLIVASGICETILVAEFQIGLFKSVFIKVIDDLLDYTRSLIDEFLGFQTLVSATYNKRYKVEIKNVNNKATFRVNNKVYNLAPHLIDFIVMANRGKSKENIAQKYKNPNSLVTEIHTFFKKDVKISTPLNKRFYFIKQYKDNYSFNEELFEIDIDADINT